MEESTLDMVGVEGLHDVKKSERSRALRVGGRSMWKHGECSIMRYGTS